MALNLPPLDMSKFGAEPKPTALPSLDMTHFASQSSTQPQARPVNAETTLQSSSLLRRLGGDVGISALKGVIGLPEAVVGLADIPTLGYAGKLAESAGFRPKEAKAILDEYLSPEQIAANKAVSEAKGFLPTVSAAVQNPSTIAHSVIESLPVMGGGGVIARGLKKSVESLSPYVAGAIGEGAVSGGLAAEQVRQQTDEGTLTPGQAAASFASGAGTAAFGAAGGRLAKKLGIVDIDTLLAGGGAGLTSKGVARRIIEGGISEGAFEELPQSVQEQIWQNAALGKPLLEGAPESGAMGLLAGGVMGGIAGGLTGRATGQEQPDQGAPFPPNQFMQNKQPGAPEEIAVEGEVSKERQAYLDGLVPITGETVDLTNPYLPTPGSPAQLPSVPAKSEDGRVGLGLRNETIEAAPAPIEAPPSTAGLEVGYGNVPVSNTLPRESVSTSNPVIAQIERLKASVAAGTAGPITKAAALTNPAYLPPVQPASQPKQTDPRGTTGLATQKQTKKAAEAPQEAVATPVTAPPLATPTQVGPTVEKPLKTPATGRVLSLPMAKLRAAQLTKATGVPHQVEAHPTEQSKFTVVPEQPADRPVESVATPEVPLETPTDGPSVTQEAAQTSTPPTTQGQVVETPVATKPTAKQPWEMTRAEVVERDNTLWGDGNAGAQRAMLFAHKAHVKTAIEEGEPVPAEVLKDYPDLQATRQDTVLPESVSAPQPENANAQQNAENDTSSIQTPENIGQKNDGDISGVLAKGQEKAVTKQTAKAEPKTTPQIGVTEPQLARLATTRERIGGVNRKRGFASIPEKEGYEVVYKPYGNDGDKSGAGYYYVPKSEERTTAPVAESQVPVTTVRSASNDMPWRMTKAEFETAREGIFEAGEAAGIGPNDIKSLEFKTQMALGKLRKAENNFRESNSVTGIERLRDSINKAQSEYDAAKAISDAAVAGRNTAWDAKQEAMLQYARSNMPSWFDDGVATEIPYRRGEPRLTLTSHKDAIRAAIKRGDVVPTKVLADYPAAFDKLIDETKAKETGQTPATSEQGDAVVAPGQGGGAPSKIEDFGEKIEGARKDLAAAMKKEYSDDDIASLPLSKIWPADLSDKIEDPYIAAIAFAARQELPSKPRVSYKVARWVEKVKVLRSLASIMMSSDTVRAKAEALLNDNKALEGFKAKVSLLESLDRSQWNRIGSVGEFPNAYRYEHVGGAESNESKQVPSPTVKVQIDGRTEYYPGAKSVADVIEKVNEKLGVAKAEAKMKFEIRGKGDSYFINKTGDSEYRKLKTFATSKEAIDYRQSHYDDLVAAWEAVKERDNVKETDVRGAKNRPRTAQDWRKGKDITTEQFSAKFGFRGGQFGNWVSQGKNIKERQGMLNGAYDALMDLSDILGIPPKAISLNGELGMSFGARGSGSASAHYESDNLVINLTKTRGAGTLAHEWFHALDNYFQRSRKAPMDHTRETRYITYKPESHYEKVDGTQMSAKDFEAATAHEPIEVRNSQDSATRNIALNQRRIENKAWWHKVEGVRPEVEEKFSALVEALNKSPMKARASMIDKGASEGYWSRIIERAARSFENYVISKMAEKGYNNDYLANVVDVANFKRDESRYPYLKQEELAPVVEAFDNLFGEMQTKETPQGTALFSRPSRDRTQTDTPEFRAWFGDSKVVDENGKPLVVYHGTDADFTEFKPTPGVNSSIFGIEPTMRNGFFFTEAKEFAQLFTKTDKTVAAYLSIKTPLDLREGWPTDAAYKKLENAGINMRVFATRQNHEMWELFDNEYGGEVFVKAAQDAGFDGAIIMEREEGGSGPKHDVYVAFRPEQIKSAIGNIGTFDPTNPNILFGRQTRDTTEPTGTTTSDARKLLISTFGEPAIRNLEKNGILKIVQNKYGLPENLRGNLRGDEEGVYYNGTGYLIADNLAEGRVVPALLHEVGEHYGLEKMLGENAYKRLMVRVRMMKGTPRVKEAWAAVIKEYPHLAEGKNDFMHEVMARLGEHADVRSKPWYKQIVQAIRLFLLKIGFTRHLSDKHIGELLLASLRKSAEGGPVVLGSSELSLASRKSDVFYSVLARGIESAKQTKASAAEWKAIIAKMEGVKKDEVEAVGLNEYLDLQTGQVTREQVLEFVRQNGVQVKEVTLGANDTKMLKPYTIEQDGSEWNVLDNNQPAFPNGRIADGPFTDRAEAAGRMESLNEDLDNGEYSGWSGPAAHDTKFASYQLPGGENYRELLLTLPVDQNNERASKSDRVKELIAKRDAVDVPNATPEQRRQWRNYETQINLVMSESIEEGKRTAFRSSHFDESNILVHVRLNERIDADGAKVLFLEELQSDYGQSFRKQKEAIKNAVDTDFNGIIERMKADGVLEVECD